MIGELQDQQQVTAASAAAATQRSPAAGASGEVRSQVKNQAFPSFLILQASLRCPGLVYIPSPGSMSRCISKNFSLFSADSFRQEVAGAPGAKTPGCRDPGQLGLVFLREFGSL